MVINGTSIVYKYTLYMFASNFKWYYICVFSYLRVGSNIQRSMLIVCLKWANKPSWKHLVADSGGVFSAGHDERNHRRLAREAVPKECLLFWWCPSGIKQTQWGMGCWLIGLFMYGSNIIILQCGPPSFVSWFIIPLTIDISPINHSYWSYKPT